MDIDSMPAGREMDRLVAERVMGIEVKLARDLDLGWEEASGTKPSVTPPACVTLNLKGDEPMMVKAPSGCIPVIQPAHVYRYSTDIAAAWMVVEKVQEIGMLDHLEQRDEAEGKYAVQFCAKPNEAWWHEHAHADTVPLAICRAALKAVEVR